MGGGGVLKNKAIPTIALFCIHHFPNGLGFGVLGLDGGRVGYWICGWLPVRVFKNATISLISASVKSLLS